MGSTRQFSGWIEDVFTKGPTLSEPAVDLLYTVSTKTGLAAFAVQCPPIPKGARQLDTHLEYTVALQTPRTVRHKDFKSNPQQVAEVDLVLDMPYC